MDKSKKIDWNTLNTGFYWAKLREPGYDYIIEFRGPKPFAKLLGWKLGTNDVSIIDPFDVLIMVPIIESEDFKEARSSNI